MALSKSLLSAAVSMAIVSVAAHAQPQPTQPAQPAQPTQRTEPVNVSARSAPALDIDAADVGGFSAPLGKTPQSISVIGADLLSATASQTLSNAIKLDASLADSYNTTGFIESVSVRGFLLSNDSNFRRNGLASSNYAPVALENIDRIEVLKGVAGLQSGVSAPGGLVNYVTKAPLKEAFTAVSLGMNELSGAKAQIDLNRNIGSLGVRINAAAESLRSHAHRADGSRQLLSLALATNLSPSTAVSFNAELHQRRQPSVPGLGLLDTNADGVGDTLPSRINSKLNLNDQSWSQPFESKTSTAQFALHHRFNAQWAARVAASVQRSRIHDRIAFPDGCSNASVYVYPGLCENGDVDVYDYRSDNERRDVSSLDALISGRIDTGRITHDLRFGTSARRSTVDTAPLQSYNYVGATNIFSPTRLDPNAEKLLLGVDSHERSADAFASIHSQLSGAVQSFAGIRVTNLNRSSERGDGSQAVAFERTVTTPWLGLTYAFSNGGMVYASWGQGVELEAVPNRADRFVNFGESLPALKSTQFEVGGKWQLAPRLLLSGALFHIEKPFADDIVQADGRSLKVVGAKLARHRGAEISAVGRPTRALSVQASVMALDATFTNAVDPAVVGTRVTNVPRIKSSLFVDYKVSAVNGLSINTLITAERGKTANTDGSVTLPSSWQLDVGLSYQRTLFNQSSTWRVNVENLTNRIYWREAPTQSWGGVYLFASAPRTIRASVAIDF